MWGEFLHCLCFFIGYEQRYFCYVNDCGSWCCVERGCAGVQAVNKFVDGRYRH